MRSFTVHKYKSGIIWVSRWKLLGSQSNGSCQILLLVPSHIFYLNNLIPLSNTTWELQMLHQIKSGLWPSWALMKSSLRKYLALKILFTKALRSDINFQPCFPSKARLKQWKSRNPSPLVSFHTHILSPTKLIYTSFSMLSTSPPKWV